MATCSARPLKKKTEQVCGGRDRNLPSSNRTRQRVGEAFRAGSAALFLQFLPEHSTPLRVVAEHNASDAWAVTGTMPARPPALGCTHTPEGKRRGHDKHTQKSGRVFFLTCWALSLFLGYIVFRCSSAFFELAFRSALQQEQPAWAGHASMCPNTAVGRARNTCRPAGRRPRGGGSGWQGEVRVCSVEVGCIIISGNRAEKGPFVGQRPAKNWIYLPKPHINRCTRAAPTATGAPKEAPAPTGGPCQGQKRRCCASEERSLKTKRAFIRRTGWALSLRLYK